MLHKIIEENGWRILLASRSPRRHELLAGCGIPFEVVDIEVDEIYPPHLTAEEVPAYLSALKCKAYPHTIEERDIVLTADTVVIRDGEVLGKPTSKVAARDMLIALQGRAHKVITGVTIGTSEGLHTFDCETVVNFAPLTEEEINYYIDECQPFDKAGSYGCQEWLGYAAIESLSGSFYNVMGLPTERLYKELKKIIK